MPQAQKNNVYERGTQRVIPAVLLYAFYDDQILMIHKKDHWNGLGGKLDLGESPLQAAVREFQEESGLSTEASSWKWLGQLFFPNFKAHKQEDWWVTVYTIELSHDQRKKIETQTITAEGTLHWVPKSKILALPLWDGDADFLPYVFKKAPFQGTLFYEEGRCVRKEVKAIWLQAGVGSTQ